MNHDLVLLIRARQALLRNTSPELRLRQDDNATEYVYELCDAAFAGMRNMGPKSTEALRSWARERVASGDYVLGTCPNAQAIQAAVERENYAWTPRGERSIDAPPEVTFTITRDGKRLHISGSLELLREFLRTFEREG